MLAPRFFAVGALLLGTAGMLLPAGAQEAAGDVDYGLFVPAPRELRQRISRAQKALDEKNYSGAVSELGEVLSQASSDDYFIPVPGNEALASLKTEAQRLLGQMPSQGRDLFELRYGAEGRALLDEALAEGSLVKLTEVTRRYFHTHAGYEAVLLLGRLQLDQGRPLAAALTFKRVADVPSAAALYDPELSLLLATAWLYAQQPGKAGETLAAAKKRLPQAKIAAGEESVGWFARDDQAVEWLTRLVGPLLRGSQQQQTQWVMFRGNEARNAASQAGLPLLDYRWRVPTVNDPRDEQEARAVSRRFRDQGFPAIPALQPLAVGDTLLMRTPERLVAVDFQTGKRIWEFPWFESPLEKAARAAAVAAGNRNQQGSPRQIELQQRLWEDTPYGQLSSDGERVYVLDDLRYAPVSNHINRAVIIAGARAQPNPGSPASTNRLVALQLRSQGKTQWVVGGENGDDEPQLAGAFFLGPPLPLQGQLYCLAEISGELRLAALSAQSGRMEWSQQLAHVDDFQTILFDSQRRLAGASPSYADGVIVCPTSAGAVVAVNLATRSLLWGYRYPRSGPEPRRVGLFSVQTTQPAPGATKWIDSSATIVEGKVLLTPVDSDELHCLDLFTGKPAWPSLKREGNLADMLYLACVHEGKIVLVGKGKVVGVNLADGKPAWERALSGATPSGRGAYSGRHYYLPLSTSEVWKIDAATGEKTAVTKTDAPLGNLVCHKDELISHSPDWLSVFYLRESLEEDIAERLKKDPRDWWALARRGEILLQDGQRQQALDTLRQAAAAAPAEEQPGLKGLLVKSMLSALKEDFAAYRRLAPEIEQLAEQPAQRAEFLRISAAGLREAGEHRAAFDALLALSEVQTGAAAELQELATDWTARPQRWIQGRLAELYLAGSEADREHFAQVIGGRVDQALAAGDREALRSAVALFDFHPRAGLARLALAEQALAASNLIVAENWLAPLLDSADQKQAGAATALWAAVMEKGQQPEAAAEQYRALGERFADVVCRGEATGRQLLEQALARPPQDRLRRALAGATWPTGRVDVQNEAASGNRFATFQRVLALPMHGAGGPPTRGLTALFDQGRGQLLVRDSFGRSLAEVNLNADGGRFYFYPAMQGYACGHLLVFSLGTEIAAIDAFHSGPSAEPFLWRQDSVERMPGAYPGYGTRMQAQRNPLGGLKQVYTDNTGKLLGGSIVVTPGGLVFQRQRQLVCVDPLTGDPLWERSGLELNGDVFGDDELVFTAPQGKEEAAVYSAVDGALLGKRSVPASDKRWITCGRNILWWTEAGGHVTLKLTDAWTGQDLWSRDLVSGAKGCLVAGEEAAVLERDGKLQAFSLRDGAARFEQKLAAEPNLLSLHVLRSREQYLAVVGHSPTDPANVVNARPAPDSQNNPLITGRVYAVDRGSGKLQWQSPAYVAQHGLLLEQPSESPVLVFLRHATQTRAVGSARILTGVLCLDRRDGRALIEDDTLQSQTNTYSLLAEPAEQKVTLTLQGATSRSWSLQFTDRPNPPAAPAQTGSASSLSVGVAPGVIDRAVEAIFGGPKPGGR